MDVEEKIPEGWLSTNQIAEALGVANITIRAYRSYHPEEFIGETTRCWVQRGTKRRQHSFWSPKAQKILGLRIKNKPIDEWKETITNEIMEKGMIITSDAKPREMIKMALQQMINVIDMQEALEERVESLELRDRLIYVTPRTKKRCRDQVARVVNQYKLSWQEVWIPKRDKYEFNGYEDMTEETAQKVIKELKEEYPPVVGYITRYIKNSE